MNDDRFELLAKMMAEISYEIHDMEGINDTLKEMLLELWRNFS